MKASTGKLLELVGSLAVAKVPEVGALSGLRDVLYEMENEARDNLWSPHGKDWLAIRKAIRSISKRLEKENNSYEGGAV